MKDTPEVGRKKDLATVDSADGYNPRDDLARSIEECYRAIRERVANGGKPWVMTYHSKEIVVWPADDEEGFVIRMPLGGAR